MYDISKFFVLMYPMNSNIDPNPCMNIANRNILKSYACNDANMSITIIMDMIIDAFLLSVYL